MLTSCPVHASFKKRKPGHPLPFAVIDTIHHYDVPAGVASTRKTASQKSTPGNKPQSYGRSKTQKKILIRNLE
jgi:hypothetical protein